MTVTTLKPGQVWRTRGGRTCTILTVQDSSRTDWPVISDLYTGHAHRLDGTSCLTDKGIDYEDNLIELLSTEQALEQINAKLIPPSHPA